MERAGPTTMQQRPFVNQELDLLRTQGQNPVASPSPPFCVCAWSGILRDFALDSGNLFSQEKDQWRLRQGT